MMNEVIMVMGAPASGKGTTAKQYIDKGYIHLNRDAAGGKVISLIPKMEDALRKGKNVVLDNLFAKAESRKPFIDAVNGRSNNLTETVPIRCVHVTTSIEEAQINALRRMYQRYGRFFMNAEELKEVKNDSNMFPPLVLFKYRKEFEKPMLVEGFSDIETVKFVRTWDKTYLHKALILDYDDNLRTTDNTLGYPVDPVQVKILPNRKEKLKEYADAGYILCGISNQSGVHKGTLTFDDAIACFEKTNELLGRKIDYTFCPHNAAPPSCYCRKPSVGNLIKLIEKYHLDVKQCLGVGDQTSDKTCFERIGIPFQFTEEFFRK
jgi:HAD superfamily hydrolase (TIGR01662 family)